ncbi:hypothetical protein [Laspinema palackyanum]|uniref:hypothetical protein n=1 Tax=Laspinema palackyanum TaxID=3231601 RepID=UPI00345D6D37|nr:ribosome-recycling factor [Laspinema sp. D2c]
MVSEINIKYPQIIMPIIPSGGSGNANATDLTKFYKHSYSGEIESIEGMERLIVPATIRPSPRTILIFNSGSSIVWLHFADSPGNPLKYPLAPGMAFSEDNAGGEANQIFLSGIGTVKVSIRSRDPINPEDIDDMPLAPLEIELLLPTGSNFPGYQYDPTMISPEGLESVNTLFQSSDGVTGYKLFDFASFQLGQSYTFSVEVASGVIIPEGNNIQVWLPNVIGNGMRAIFEVASDLLNPEIDGLPTDFVGRIKQNGWVGNFPHTGSLFTLKPNLSRKIGAIYAKNPQTNYFECAIINFDAATKVFTILGF